MAINLTQPAAAPITSAEETKATLETFKELGSDYGDAVVESFVSRLGDQIDDRVAEAFDEKLTERMGQPGPLRSAATRDKRAGLAVLASMLMGTLATILASGIAEVALAWVGLAAINIAYLSRRNLPGHPPRAARPRPGSRRPLSSPREPTPAGGLPPAPCGPGDWRCSWAWCDSSALPGRPSPTAASQGGSPWTAVRRRSSSGCASGVNAERAEDGEVPVIRLIRPCGAFP